MLRQYIINGIQTGSITALVGVGYLLIYRTGRFFHFAHGIIFTWGAYFLSLLLRRYGHFPLLFALFSVLLTITLGLFLEISTYRPLRRQNASATILLIAALGLYIVLQNIISIIFGDDTLSFRWWSIRTGWNIFDARITPIQTFSVLITWFLLFLVWIFLKKTSIGLKMNAVAINPKLAEVLGIKLEGIYLWAMGLGSMLAAIAGILTASDVDMTPTMGMQPMMMGVVAAIIGGNTLWGTACGAMLLGLTQHLSVVWLPTKWQDAIAFFILLIFLLFRPQGFSSKQKREAKI